MQLRTNILEKLEEIINRNDDTVNRIIAQTILNFAKVPNETFIINDVAETSHTSVSVVTNFCKMLGFNG